MKKQRDTGCEVELHLVLVWSEGLYALEHIIEDLEKHFQIAGQYVVIWSPNVFSSNLTRFYGQSLPPNSFKEKHCGNGPFRLFLVLDKNPKYGLRKTSRGVEHVNTNLFDAKQRCRDFTGGGHKVHTTNTPTECAHDLYLLLGETYASVLNGLLAGTRGGSGEIREWRGNLTGHDGWNSLEQLFEAMNQCLAYVVLRNYECLPVSYRLEEHGDIDFLVDDLFNAVAIMGARKMRPESFRVNYLVSVGGLDIPVDLRYVGDNYYCAPWAEDILDARVLNELGVYVPSPSHYYRSLTYHVFFHKYQIASDYPAKLEMARNLALPGTQRPCRLFDSHFEDLAAFLKENNYPIAKPADNSVGWDARYLFRPETVCKALDAVGICDVKLFRSEEAKNNTLCPEQVYFRGTWRENGREAFIKWAGNPKAVQWEFEILEKLHARCPKNFPKPLFYTTGRHTFLAIEFLPPPADDGHSLTPAFIVGELTNIADALFDCKILHRNIHPEHLLLSQDRVCLIGFALAVDCANDFLPESRIFGMTPKVFWRRVRPQSSNPLFWDDAQDLFIAAIKKFNLTSTASKDLRSRIGRLALSLEP